MIKVPDEDRNMIRFLLFKDMNDGNAELEHFRITRLVFGLKPSPAILGAIISHHLQLFKEQHPDVVRLIEDSLYVDDMVSGAEDDERAFHVYQISKHIMAKEGFNLRKWNSNSVTLLQRIQEAELSSEPIQLSAAQKPK